MQPVSESRMLLCSRRCFNDQWRGHGELIGTTPTQESTILRHTGFTHLLRAMAGQFPPVSRQKMASQCPYETLLRPAIQRPAIVRGVFAVTARQALAGGKAERREQQDEQRDHRLHG